MTPQCQTTVLQRTVFLDIDGVLNSVSWQERRPKRDAGIVLPDRAVWGRMIDPAAVRLLDVLLERTGAKVVVSSAWRTMMPLAEIVEILRGHGFTGEVVGQTPEMEGAARWDEIARWLADHAPNGHWAVLDDDPMPGAGRLLVRTDYAVGLTAADVGRAVALLNWAPEQGQKA